MNQLVLEATLPLDQSAKVVPSGYTRLFLDVLAENGVDPWVVMGGTELTPAHLSMPGNMITLTQQVKIYERIGTLHDSSRLTLSYGSRIRPNDHGPLGYAVQAAPNLRKALATFNKYYNVLGPLGNLLVVEQDALVRWITTSIVSSGPARQVAAEEMLSGGVTLLRQITGTKFPLREVWLDYDPGNAIRLYRDLMQCPVLPNMPAIEIRFAADLLDSPLVYADAQTEHQCIELCKQRVAQIDSVMGIKGAVRRLILENIGENFSFEDIARRLHVSPRGVRRALARESTSFQQIQNDVRRDLAESYMLTSDIGIDSIGFLLGYSDPANFRNAFKKWTGLSPGAFRRLHLAKPKAHF